MLYRSSHTTSFLRTSTLGAYSSTMQTQRRRLWSLVVAGWLSITVLRAARPKQRAPTDLRVSVQGATALYDLSPKIPMDPVLSCMKLPAG